MSHLTLLLVVASSNSFAFTIPPWRLNHSTWKKQHDICFVWFHVIEEIATTSLSQAQGKQTRHQTENYSNNQNANKCSKVILLPHSFGMMYRPKWMQNSPKQKHMQQSNPIFLFAWLTLPKWMENNPKPKQMQQRSPKMETIQSQNKCSKVILMQWQWLFTLLNLLDCLFRLSVEKVWYASFLFLYVSSECCTWTDALRSMWFAVVCSRVRFKTCKRNSTH